MKMFGAVTFADGRKAATQIFISRRTGKKRAAQGPKIKAGAACKNRQIVALFDLVNLCGGFSRPITGCVIDMRRNEVDQVMRHSTAFVRWNFCGSNLNPLVYLDRITIDDFAVEFEG